MRFPWINRLVESLFGKTPGNDRFKKHDRRIRLESLEDRRLLTINPFAYGPDTTEECKPLLLGLDPGTRDVTQWSIDFDGNGPLTAETFSGSALQASHTYPDGAVTGTDFAIAIAATDGTTTWNLTHDVSVFDVAPILNTYVEGFEQGQAQVGEGQEFRLYLDVDDPGTDSISEWIINWGDGTSPQQISGSPEFVAHTYADNPPAGQFYTISASATNEDGTYAEPEVGDPGDVDLSFGDGGRVTTDFGGSSDQAMSAVLDAHGRLLAAR